MDNTTPSQAEDTDTITILIVNESKNYETGDQPTCEICQCRAENGEKWTEAKIKNPENEQHTFYALIHEECENDALQDIFFTKTNQYYAYSHTGVDDLVSAIEELKERIEKLNEDDEDFKKNIEECEKEIEEEKANFLKKCEENDKEYPATISWVEQGQDFINDFFKN